MKDQHQYLEDGFHIECMEFTYEFLAKVSRSLVVQDGPFIYLIGKSRDACYEIVDDDLFRQAKVGKRIKIIQ